MGELVAAILLALIVTALPYLLLAVIAVSLAIGLGMAALLLWITWLAIKYAIRLALGFLWGSPRRPRTN